MGPPAVSRVQERDLSYESEAQLPVLDLLSVGQEPDFGKISAHEMTVALGASWSPPWHPLPEHQPRSNSKRRWNKGPLVLLYTPGCADAEIKFQETITACAGQKA